MAVTFGSVLAASDVSGLSDFAIDALGSALLQRTYLIQSKGLSGVPVLLCVFDAVSSETPTYVAEITQHPVESSREVTDHIQLKNSTLKIMGTVSAYPIDLSVTVGNLISGAQSLTAGPAIITNTLNAGFSQLSAVAGGALQGGAASADTIARAALLSAYQNKTIFDCITKRQRYQSMAIARLSFPRDANTGRQCIFELDMEQVRIVNTDTVLLSSVTESVNATAVPSQSLGSQATSGITAQAQAAIAASPFAKLKPTLFGG